MLVATNRIYDLPITAPSTSSNEDYKGKLRKNRELLNRNRTIMRMITIGSFSINDGNGNDNVIN